MDKKLFKAVKSCRICGNEDLVLILDLGDQPPANSLRGDLETPLPKIPLQLFCCSSCGSVQLSVSVSPEYLFRHYVWVTGTAETTRKYSQLFCDRILERMPTEGRFKVIEIASNDGTFLRPFKEMGHEILGVDPAGNIAKLANKAGIDTIPEFFGTAVADKIVSSFGHADCIFARNVVPHVEDAHDVLEGMRRCMDENALGAIEFHYAGKIHRELHYDSIYHEHNLYLSLTSLCRMFRDHGLTCFDVTESPISGGSLVAYFSNKKKIQTPSFKRVIENEARTGLNTVKVWKDFARRSIRHKKALVNAIRSIPAKIIGYGASARSSTLLNFCGIDNSILECIADKSQMKHNKFTPGTDIRIVSPDEAFGLKPSSVLLLAWNFRDEILKEIKDKYGFSGQVVIPFPGKVRIVKVKS